MVGGAPIAVALMELTEFMEFMESIIGGVESFGEFW